ncbi:hypothetical protein ACA910_010047 [Epithemia clementina (nom. ined.)]
MDIASTSQKRCDWNRFNVSGTRIGDTGVEVLARAFVTTYVENPVLVLSGQSGIDNDAAGSLAKALQDNPSWGCLDLRSTGIGKRGLHALSRALRGNKAWKLLSLLNTAIEDDEAIVLASALKQNKNWTWLHLGYFELPMERVRPLADALKTNPSWSKLDLCLSGIETRGMKALAAALCKNGQWETLNLSRTSIHDEGAIALASALGQNTCWKVFDFTRTPMGVWGAKELAAALKGNVSWRYLFVNIYNLGRNEISMIAQHLQQTKDWERFVVHFRQDDLDSSHKGTAPARLAQAIAQQQKPGAWKSLVLWFPNAGADVMNTLAQHLSESRNPSNNHNQNIPDLFITNETTENAVKMADYLGQCWLSMDIFFFDSDRGLSGEKENAIVKHKAAGDPNADRVATNAVVQASRDCKNFGRTLSLHHSNLTTKGAMRLAEALSLSDAWTHFSMSYSRIGDSGAIVLADALRSNCNASWQFFDSSNTSVGDRGARWLAQALYNNNTWEVLSIASTPITDDGVYVLSMALGRRDWHTVDLGNTEIGNEGIMALSRSLVFGKSKSWKHLRLANSAIQDSGAIKMSLVLLNSTNWRVLDVGSTAMSDSDIVSVATAIERHPSWRVLDLRSTKLLKNEVVGAVKNITEACPTWKTIEGNIHGQPRITAGENGSFWATGVQGCLLSRDTHLELLILNGLAKCDMSTGIDRSCFMSLGQNLLDIAESLAKVNTCRIAMAGGDGKRLQKLSSLRQRQVRQIFEFGLQLAALMFRIIGDQQKPSFDLFISFAGEDRYDYVKLLRNEMPPQWKIFLDDESMYGGMTGDPPSTMFEHVLTAKVVLSVASVHYVQKKWPMAELLCGLARNRAVGAHGRSPLIVDAMPGYRWTLNPELWKTDHDPGTWLDDLTVLLPTALPAMQKYCKKGHLLQHRKVIKGLVRESLSAAAMMGTHRQRHSRFGRLLAGKNAFVVCSVGLLFSLLLCLSSLMHNHVLWLGIVALYWLMVSLSVE